MWLAFLPSSTIFFTLYILHSCFTINFTCYILHSWFMIFFPYYILLSWVLIYFSSYIIFSWFVIYFSGLRFTFSVTFYFPGLWFTFPVYDLLSWWHSTFQDFDFQVHNSLKNWMTPRLPLLSWCFTHILKELSLCHKLWFSNFYIFATKCCRPLIFQTINSARASNLREI